MKCPLKVFLMKIFLEMKNTFKKNASRKNQENQLSKRSELAVPRPMTWSYLSPNFR